MPIPKKDGYLIIKREQMIDDLIRWMSETKSANDRELMKEDLKMLLSWTCEYIYSSESTNDYLEI